MNKIDCKYTIILLGIIFVWAVMLFFCLFEPYTAAVHQLKDESARQADSLAALQKFKEGHGSLKEYESRLEAARNILQDKLPEDMNEGRFLSDLSQSARYSSVQLLSIEPIGFEQTELKESEMPPGAECREFIVSCRGSFFAVLKFLRSLNAMPRLVVIKNGSLKAENASIYCKLTLQIYSDTYNI